MRRIGGVQRHRLRHCRIRPFLHQSWDSERLWEITRFVYKASVRYEYTEVYHGHLYEWLKIKTIDVTCFSLALGERANEAFSSHSRCHRNMSSRSRTSLLLLHGTTTRKDIFYAKFGMEYVSFHDYQWHYGMPAIQILLSDFLRISQSTGNSVVLARHVYRLIYSSV